MKKRYAAPLVVAAMLLAVQSVPLYAADMNGGQTMGEKLDDATITSKVKMELMKNSATSAMQTDVDTTDGVVTLTGKARNNAEKELATQIASQVKGVKNVVNKMVIEPPK